MARPHPSRAEDPIRSGGMKARSKTVVHELCSSWSGGGRSGGEATVSTSADSSGRWKLASRFRMAPTAWRATTRRVAKERPSRMRSTS